MPSQPLYLQCEAYIAIIGHSLPLTTTDYHSLPLTTTHCDEACPSPSCPPPKPAIQKPNFMYVHKYIIHVYVHTSITNTYIYRMVWWVISRGVYFVNHTHLQGLKIQLHPLEALSTPLPDLQACLIPALDHQRSPVPFPVQPPDPPALPPDLSVRTLQDFIQPY